MANSNHSKRRRLLALVVTFAVVGAAISATPVKDIIPECTSIRTGAIFYNEIHDTANPARFLDHTRMKDRDMFDGFVGMLRQIGDMDDNPEISASEKLMIFIDALTGTSYRKLKSTWNHSTSTISEILHEVAHALLK